MKTAVVASANRSDTGEVAVSLPHGHIAPSSLGQKPMQEITTLTKAHLADLLFTQLGMNKRESKVMVDALFDLLSERLVRGHDVRLSNFGNFQVRSKSPRPGRNPRTGETVSIGERRVVTFHASLKLKDQIQNRQQHSMENTSERV